MLTRPGEHTTMTDAAQNSTPAPDPRDPNKSLRPINRALWMLERSGRRHVAGRKTALTFVGFFAILALVAKTLQDFRNVQTMGDEQFRTVTWLAIGVGLVLCVTVWKARRKARRTVPAMPVAPTPTATLPEITEPLHVPLADGRHGYLWMPGGEVFLVSPTRAPMRLTGQELQDAIVYMQALAAAVQRPNEQ
ncbi:hypothetical protein [Cupriavidus pauculus]|uniref:hypothetical protein n=1 Tax=Cupriavidus pauculus TaxID=82633 RepID=UPI0038574276